MIRQGKLRSSLGCLLVVTTYWCALAFTTSVQNLEVRNGPPRTSIWKAAVVDDGSEVEELPSFASIQNSHKTPWTLRHLSPYHLEHPEAFYSRRAPLDQKLPLNECLNLFKKALNSLLIPSKIIPLETKEGDVVRIEHTISHAVDPLCWLQAQNQAIRPFNHPSTYFANDDGTFEAAAVGSTFSFSGTTNEDSFWALVKNLPAASHLYGGQRFDEQSPIDEEWAAFGRGLWLLPAVEVRREVFKENNTTATTISVHIIKQNGSFQDSVQHVQNVLNLLTSKTTPAVPPTTLPPILSRTNVYRDNIDAQELYEKGISAALDEFQRSDSNLEKVVLARRMDLQFSKEAADNLDALDILRKWKFALTPGGHLFYLNPGSASGNEFFGSTPERLFRVDDRQVTSEALAGTRPRGSSQEDDQALAQQLFGSDKDKSENLITGKFINDAFMDLRDKGLLDYQAQDDSSSLLIRRLRHLQHICQRYDSSIPQNVNVWDSSRALFEALHPTPALCGAPKVDAMNFIREHEGVGFDRGLYAGPVGFVGKERAEIVVGIRSGLIQREGSNPHLSVYAGAGIVRGSTVQGEWAETSYKLEVVSSIFPQSPITLKGAPTPNAAWATAFIEELVRSGVTQFYIGPGSRSTPLVAAIAKAVKSNQGVVNAISMHDERGAAFRAIGYGRGSGCPAAVVTSSGTAVANLYPAVIEASAEGIPLLLLTADRPYESRGTGANQAIDQVKIFSETYIRWFRDILPPSDDITVASALADATHSVNLSRKLRGPVHMNIQFRENLAPDAGKIRNDDRLNSVTKYDSIQFTEAPSFKRWSRAGNKWMHSYSASGSPSPGIARVSELISKSRRGIIVVGNLRAGIDDEDTHEHLQVVHSLSALASRLGFPIFCSALSGALRFESTQVVPFAENLLRCKRVSDNIKPDLVIQFGAPLISTEIPKMIKSSIDESSIPYVVIHPHQTSERADPDFMVSHQIDSEIDPFVSELSNYLDKLPDTLYGSDLAPLIQLGKALQQHMPHIITESASIVRQKEDSVQAMSEPEVALALSQVFSDRSTPDLSLFLSNSMPIRDAEAFMYPVGNFIDIPVEGFPLKQTAVNRGASGIDGIIASAAGFADSAARATTLLVGDVAALHDLNSLHSLHSSYHLDDHQDNRSPPLTTIVINNDGGGIFSFLPIASHGNDVGFEEFFGTPTKSFSFESGAKAFSLPYKRVEDAASLKFEYSSSLEHGNSILIEAVVSTRSQNVLVHQEITQRANSFINDLIGEDEGPSQVLPIKDYGSTNTNDEEQSKTLVLLHGWMGDKSEWDTVAAELVTDLPKKWRVLSVDLPGHGESELRLASPRQDIRSTLGLGNAQSTLGLDSMGDLVDRTLRELGIDKIDAIAGYSLGGRVALAMKRKAEANHGKISVPSVVDSNTDVILISTWPGDFREEEREQMDTKRLANDSRLRQEICCLSNRAVFSKIQSETSLLVWSNFLKDWYGKPMWGTILQNATLVEDLLVRRSLTLSRRGKDLAEALIQCSPPVCRDDDWCEIRPERTLFVSGEMDTKYTSIGKDWASLAPGLNFCSIPGKGHALLVEAPGSVAKLISSFLLTDVTSFSSTESKNEATKQQSIGVEYAADQPESIRSSKGSMKIEFDVMAASLEYEDFSIDFVDDLNRKQGISGIGWGQKAAANNLTRKRSGLIIQIMSGDGLNVGVGEVSPLPGLHPESLDEAKAQLDAIAAGISDAETSEGPPFDAREILALDGGLTQYLTEVMDLLEIPDLLASVRSGLEMAIISLASQILKKPIHEALQDASPPRYEVSTLSLALPLNGLITRGSASNSVTQINGGEGQLKTGYESWKVKVGHQTPYEDAMALSYAYQVAQSSSNGDHGKIRADANRSFTLTDALNFARILQSSDAEAFQKLEYIEEPLKRILEMDEGWSIYGQVEALEEMYEKTGIQYALDESLSDLAEQTGYNFDKMSSDLQGALRTNSGCAAIILKPSLLGQELSMQLARFARWELGIGAVFTSSFDSGVGLAFASFLGSLSDSYSTESVVKTYAHGLGTFDMLSNDCISPNFGSYVKDGKLNVASLSRSFYGLGLDEVECLSTEPLPPPTLSASPPLLSKDGEAFRRAGVESLGEFEASTSTSKDGREINLVASLPLPFSSEIASSRFTDLPQQPRWSPWITSVAYVESRSETEWTLQVRGVQFRWRAISFLLDDPYRGIRWESVSGLKNTGAVEFIPTDDTDSACIMKVQMNFVAPRVLAPLFKGTSIFFEDFIRNKVLKWSLEMFRDVVKGDLVLEEGNIELGDALFAAVEGKANAIEATLANPLGSVGGLEPTEEG